MIASASAVPIEPDAGGLPLGLELLLVGLGLRLEPGLVVHRLGRALHVGLELLLAADDLLLLDLRGQLLLGEADLVLLALELLDELGPLEVVGDVGLRPLRR